MSIMLGIIFAIVWLFFIHVMRQAKLKAWKFIWGSCGLFVLMMIFIRPYFTEPLAKVVASIAGVFGNLTGMYSSFFKYGVIFVDSASGSISLLIDFECSGILEIMAFVALLAFYDVYTVYERILIGLVGTAYIILANALRIFIICTIIYFNGISAYSFAHTIVGRVVFYGLSVILYFIVFTKGHIRRQKVGNFTYGVDK